MSSRGRKAEIRHFDWLIIFALTRISGAAGRPNELRQRTTLQQRGARCGLSPV